MRLNNPGEHKSGPVEGLEICEGEAAQCVNRILGGSFEVMLDHSLNSTYDQSFE